jgi:hypothetical protein
MCIHARVIVFFCCGKEVKLYKEGEVMVNLDADVVFQMSTTVVTSNKVSQTRSLR